MTSAAYASLYSVISDFWWLKQGGCLELKAIIGTLGYLGLRASFQNRKKEEKIGFLNTYFKKCLKSLLKGVSSQCKEYKLRYRPTLAVPLI